MLSSIEHQTNIMIAPSYAYVMNNQSDDGFTYKDGERYPILWNKGDECLFSKPEPTENNQIVFKNVDLTGGFVRSFINTGITDEEHNAFAYVYYPSTKDLFCLALQGNEARFGGVVIEPNIQ